MNKGMLAGLLFSISLGALGASGPPLPIVVDALITHDTQTGIGPALVSGQMVKVHYTGWLYDPTQTGGKGKKFDSSLDRGSPFTFTPGEHRVIKGWEQGVPGMQVGGKRTLIIPPDLAYGDRNVGNGVIPPQSTLLFEVQLLEILTPPPPPPAPAATPVTPATPDAAAKAKSTPETSGKK